MVFPLNSVQLICYELPDVTGSRERHTAPLLVTVSIVWLFERGSAEAVFWSDKQPLKLSEKSN